MTMKSAYLVATIVVHHRFIGGRSFLLPPPFARTPPFAASLRRVMEDIGRMENDNDNGGGNNGRGSVVVVVAAAGERTRDDDESRQWRTQSDDGTTTTSVVPPPDGGTAIGGGTGHTITDPQALADYYLQHENIPRVILHADLLGRSAHAQIMRILPKGGASPAVATTTASTTSGPTSATTSRTTIPRRLVSSTPEWKRLHRHADEVIRPSHLRDMLRDDGRCASMIACHDGVYFDYSRQRVTSLTMDLLFDLAERQDLGGKIRDMFAGEKINFTEDRAVLHTALRAGKDEMGSVIVDGVDVIGEVHDVLDQVRKFTDAFRAGEITGYTGKRMRNIVSVGIGGSYLGPEFLHEVLKTESEGINTSLGYDLRFLANVDPVDVERTCADLDPEETLIIVVSKTFTTAETMLNARTMRQWLWDFMGDDADVVRRHVIACSSVSATENVRAFGIDTNEGMFRFWDWVGGRYSVCGAAGAVPISLMYGYDLFEKFLEGARSMDRHFLNAPPRENIPIIMGLLGCWNSSFMGYSSRALIPYAQALLRLPAHIQQLDMESNGKRINSHGVEIDYPVGEVDFGEPGTNSQHSFFQMIHQGQTVPVDFLGFVRSQHDLLMDNEKLSSHDELMANFFAQPDALANGKTAEEVRAEGCPEDLVLHKVFDGNRPSSSLLFPQLSAYVTGQILSLYEHRTAVQGFIWDLNSFDQWGVELGKKLALDVKEHLMEARNNEVGDHEIKIADNPATSRIMNYYVENSRDAVRGGGSSSPVTSATSVTRKTHKDHFPPQINDLGGLSGRLS